MVCAVSLITISPARPRVTFTALSYLVTSGTRTEFGRNISHQKNIFAFETKIFEFRCCHTGQWVAVAHPPYTPIPDTHLVYGNCCHNILQTIVNSGLLFTDGPVFTKEPVSVTGNAGERVSLECEVDSNPPAQYEWTRDGEVCGTSKIFIIIFYFCDSLLKYYPNIFMKI